MIIRQPGQWLPGIVRHRHLSTYVYCKGFTALGAFDPEAAVIAQIAIGVELKFTFGAGNSHRFQNEC
jgi:hypothetical protein